MKFSYKKLQTYFNEPLPSPEKLADTLTFSFAEVESVERDGGDSIMDIKVLPDRAGYAKSYEGIALEISAALKIRRKDVDQSKSIRKISAKVSDINRVLGLEIPVAEIKEILERLNLEVGESGDLLIIGIPENRNDLQDWRDIPEEIGRIYGYDKIEAKMPPKIEFQPKPDKALYYSEKIKNILMEKGFCEVYLYSLVPKGDFEVEKPLAADKNYLRTNLSDGIVKSLEMNARNADLLGLDAIQIFEIGRVFKKDGEHTSLAIGIKNLKKKDEKEKEKIKKVRDELLEIIESNAQILCTVDDSGGIISIQGKQIGTTNNVEGIMELDLDALVETLPDPKSYNDLGLGKSVDIQYKKFSHYPFIVRDIAVFVPESINSGEIWENIEKSIAEAGALDILVKHSLFDTFKKDGKTSYAFRIIFQSHDRTLTDDEVNAAMAKVSENIKSAGWEVR